MKITKVSLRNFRRLEEVDIDFEENETVFVGPNNSGKTSASSAFELFLKTGDFKIHDFSVARISEIDAVGREEETDLPSIYMDLWFSINPDIEFGRVFTLLPNISVDIHEVGIRIQFSLKDIGKLKEDYFSAFPIKEDNKRNKSLSHFLSLQGNLSRHFGLVYWTLENDGEKIEKHHMDSEEARKTLDSLIRVDFVDAQRNINDHETARSTRLSKTFATYYKHNLKQADVNEKANRIIEKNNENLNDHYEESFSDIMKVLKGLGVPSVNDRKLKLISSLDPEIALKGNTTLLYVDTNYDHELPEAYNGLGFKNLVYIVLQVSHYYLQWLSTEEKRPLCQVIFIEEPEVHLHSQVQQTFISNLWEIIGNVADENMGEEIKPQLVVSTHSSHILDAVDFEKVRYFKRCCLSGENHSTVSTMNASKVLSMRTFQPNRASASGKVENETEVLSFLKKYLRLTHCDLFFSDAAILVEGAAEKLLLPAMIQKAAPGLNSTYLSVLEVGGAYASRFSGLLEFIGIPYLVITDIDSVDPENKRKACRADIPGAVTSNSSIKFYLNKSEISELKALNDETLEVASSMGYIAYQKPILAPPTYSGEEMFGRTFEESFIYQNIDNFKDRNLECGFDIPESAEEVRQTVFEEIKSPTFKKTDFALHMGATDVEWAPPSYISSGLTWLQKILGVEPKKEDK